MKTIGRRIRQRLFCRLTIPLNALPKAAGVMIAAAFLICAVGAIAQTMPPGYTPLPTPLDSWSFYDITNWTDDLGDAPVSFTNIISSDLGDGRSLDVDTNIPAWIDYNIYEPTTGATNLTVKTGSITFWYAPNWTTTNGGPAQWAELIDVGEWTSNSSYGYWGFSIDPSGSNVLFLSQDGLGDTYGLYSPISWTTNYFHYIALTYSSTNVSLYLDGLLATNDPDGLGIWPDATVLSNGVFFGSDMNGDDQAQGLFNTIQTYSSNFDSGTIQRIFNSQNYYNLMPQDAQFMGSGSSNPSTNSTAPDAITGAGYLQWDGTNANCASSTNGDNVWITNLVVTPSSNGLMDVTFSIDGGTNGWLYDVFATGQLEIPLSSGTWSWMGQGLSCNTYTIPNVNSTYCFLILGTPWDSDNSDLTDAYQLLVSKTDPYIQDSDFDGLITGWEILLGLNPHISNINNSSQRYNYSYTSADWLNGISGIKGRSSITMDNEGNLTQVSQ